MQTPTRDDLQYMYIGPLKLSVYWERRREEEVYLKACHRTSCWWQPSGQDGASGSRRLHQSRSGYACEPPGFPRVGLLLPGRRGNKNRPYTPTLHTHTHTHTTHTHTHTHTHTQPNYTNV